MSRALRANVDEQAVIQDGMTKIELKQIKDYLKRNHSQPEFKAFWDVEKVEEVEDGALYYDRNPIEFDNLTGKIKNWMNY